MAIKRKEGFQMGFSTLRGFSFGNYKGVDSLPEKVISLFLDMLENPTKNVECTEEIVNAALEGRINFDKDFDLRAYAFAVQSNTKLIAERNRKKFVYIDFSNDDEENKKSYRTGGIKIDQVSVSSAKGVQASSIKDMKDSFEEVVDNEELIYAIDMLKSIREDFLINEGVDLISLLSNALSGIPQAIDKLKVICDDCAIVGEQIKIILSSGKDVSSLLTCS